MVEQAEHNDLLVYTTEIVSAHLSNNPVQADEIPALIQKVYKTLANVASDGSAMAERPQPAVPIKRSITPDYIVCLEDGETFKSLKRHLTSHHEMSPEDYRERWGLPADYPMVAPNYAKQRSKLARQIGLGTRRKKRSNGKS